MKEKTYRVIGDCRVHGHAAGETFCLAIGAAQEAALIQGGHIEAVSKGADASTTTTKKEEEHG